jgi:RNA polymerase sigma-70 factor, ECF subfamily
MSFEEIYKNYWPKVFRLCMGYVNNNAWAKDLAQETFINVWQQLPKFRNESSIGTWIFRIASNQCLRQIDKENRLPKTVLQNDFAEETHPSIETKLALLYKSISELAETDRIIISLELEDIKQSDIASIVGISEANVRVKIHRIKEKLHQKLKDHEH